MSDWETVGTVAAPSSEGWETVGSVSGKPAEEAKPAPKGFLATLTAPGFMEEMTGAHLYRRSEDVQLAREQFNKAGEYEKEKARRVAAGESTNPLAMLSWETERVSEIIKAGKPPTPDTGMKELLGALWEQTKSDPGGVLGGVVRGAFAAPELFLLPEAVPAFMARLAGNLGKAAQTTARLGAEATQAGAAAAGESVLRQTAETGGTNPSQTATDALMMAAPVVAVKAAKASLGRAGKVVGENELAQDVADGIKSGKSAMDAVRDVMEKYGVPEADAAKISESTAIEPYEPGRSAKQELSTDKGKSWTPLMAAGMAAAGAAGYGLMDEDQRQQAQLLGMAGATALVGKELPWYSPTAKAIFTKAPFAKNETIPAASLSSWLEARVKDGVIPADEVQFSGLQEWLKLQDAPVSKADVDAFMRNNGVQVQEKILGGVSEETGSTQGQPKFSSWQLPGGENYRELLLTLPQREASPFDDAKTRIEQGAHPVPQEDFTGGHYNEPNTLAHIRFNDRYDADGKRVLFIEEIQSDWAQTGRKEGFATKLPAVYGWTSKSGETTRREFATTAEADRYADEVMKRPDFDGGGMTYASVKGPPQAPFVGKTEAWTGLALKRMIKYAADNGYDRVAWTNGEQQAARYDLSKQVDAVRWEKNKAGEYRIHALKDGRDTGTAEWISENKIEDVVGKEVAQRIVDGVGAEKMADTQNELLWGKGNTGLLQGLDLKVGGEGQRAFYDKIIPNVANDILKKLGGGKVSEVPIELGKEMREWRNQYEGPTPTPEQLSLVRRAVNAGPRDSRAHPLTGQPLDQIVNRVSNKSAVHHIEREMREGKSFKQAIEENGTNEVAELFGGKLITDQGQKVRGQPGFDITPAMRAKASKPMSPFRQEGRIDPELVKALGLAGLGGAAAFYLTGDKDKAIAAAVAMGMLPVARGMARKVGMAAGRATDFMVDKRYNPKEVFRDFAAGVRVPEYTFQQWQKAADALLPKMPKAQKEQSWVRVRDYVQGHRDVPLSPQEHAMATEIRTFLDHVYSIGQQGDVLHSYLENYLPGLYRKKPFANWTDIINRLMQEEPLAHKQGMRPKTRHAMEKVIPDYRTVDALIASGQLDLVPLTKNPAEMARLAANSVNKAVQVKKLINTLQTLNDTTGTPLVVTRSPVLTERAINDAVAAAGTQLGATRLAQDLWAQFDLQRLTKDYVTINHPSLLGLKVHRDFVGPLRMLFDTSDPRGVLQGAYALSMAHKSLLFSMSLFHASTLAAVQLPLIAGRAVAQAMSGMRPAVFKHIPNAWEANAGKQISPVAQEMLRTGATLGHGIQDVDPSFMQRIFEFAQTQVGKIPAVGPMLSGAVAIPKFVHQKVSQFIFDQVQPTFKMATWMAEDALWRKKHPNATPAEIEAAHRQMSEGVNVLYGGLNWFELANNVPHHVARTVTMALLTPGARKFQQIALLAPDWNIAALRAWTEGIKAFNPMISEKASDGLYCTYLLGSSLVYLGMADYLQQKYTGKHIWDQEDWTYVDRGDGTKIQLNKHFMEAVHLYHDPSRFVLGKLGYIPSELIAQGASAEYVTHKDGKIIAPPMRDGRFIHALKRFFSPITLQGIFNPEQLVAGNLGMQITGKNYEQRVKEATERAKATGKDANAAADRARSRNEREKEQRRQAR